MERKKEFLFLKDLAMKIENLTQFCESQVQNFEIVVIFY